MPVCAVPNCSKNASFSNVGEKPKFCSTHKEENMVNVINKKCLGEECSLRPSFNILGGKPLYCGLHKLDNMVNSMTKFCEHQGCLITPVYNLPDIKGGRFCSTHKEEGMINVVNNICEKEGCNKSPSFCFGSEKKSRFCGLHKEDGMVDMKHKKCLFDSCLLTPSYANVGDKSPKYCLEHKLEEMVNVKHKKCANPDCNLIPSYNKINEKTALFCREHRAEGMIDVTHKKCLSQWCDNRIVINKYEDYCVFCFIHLFPDKPITKNYKTKEKAIVDFVVAEFPNVTWISDKRVIDGCSRRRPDLFLDMGNQVIIIEIDENQHTNYDCSCENKRLMEISKDIGHRNLIFIRFNPDQYINRNGEKVKSCWSINKQGVSTITKNTNREWNERLNSLKAQVHYWINNSTEKMVEVIQLYYDEDLH